MIKTSDFCSEREALETLVGRFATEMESKVLAKLFEGCARWDDPDWIPYLMKQIDKHVKKCDWVDVANIAMFLSNFDFSCIGKAGVK